MPIFADYIFSSALHLGLANVYVGIVNNSTSTAYKTGPTPASGLFVLTAPAGLYTVYTSPTGSGNPPGGDWVATGETSYVVNPASPVANTDLAGPLLNAITAGSNLSVGGGPAGVGSQSVALVANPTLTGLLTAQAGLTLTGLLTFLTGVSQIVPGATSLSLRNAANTADNLLLTDAGLATFRNDLALSAGKLTMLGTNVGAGTLGYAQITANQGAITAQTDLTSLAVTVTAGPSRRLRISAYLGNVGSSVSGDVFALYIMEGATQLAKSVVTGPTGNLGMAVVAQAVIQPSNGSHTYKLQGARDNGTGTYTLNASATTPCFILVEDIGT